MIDGYALQKLHLEADDTREAIDYYKNCKRELNTWAIDYEDQYAHYTSEIEDLEIHLSNTIQKIENMGGRYVYY